MRPLTALVFALLLATAGRGGDAPKVGDTIGKLKFTDIRSLPRTPEDFGKKKAIVAIARRILGVMMALMRTGQAYRFAEVPAPEAAQ